MYPPGSKMIHANNRQEQQTAAAAMSCTGTHYVYLTNNVRFEVLTAVTMKNDVF
jgi:hypothetical protein